jgi:hypothetical protein
VTISPASISRTYITMALGPLPLALVGDEYQVPAVLFIPTRADAGEVKELAVDPELHVLRYFQPQWRAGWNLAQRIVVCELFSSIEELPLLAEIVEKESPFQFV